MPFEWELAIVLALCPAVDTMLPSPQPGISRLALLHLRRADLSPGSIATNKQLGLVNRLPVWLSLSSPTSVLSIQVCHVVQRDYGSSPPRPPSEDRLLKVKVRARFCERQFCIPRGQRSPFARMPSLSLQIITSPCSSTFPPATPHLHIFCGSCIWEHRLFLNVPCSRRLWALVEHPPLTFTLGFSS